MSKVLIIDDEEDVRKYLQALLHKHGYETITASDGKEGLTAVRSQKPDLITLDLMMPNQSGTDFYRQLAQDKELGETPVIVVSGLPGRHLAVREPVAVFDKPIEPQAFLEAVRKAIG